MGLPRPRNCGYLCWIEESRRFWRFLNVQDQSKGSGAVRQGLLILTSAILLAGCASDLSERDDYPHLSDVRDRPSVALTPERTDELTVILNAQRLRAQRIAALGFREEQDVNALRETQPMPDHMGISPSEHLTPTEEMLPEPVMAPEPVATAEVAPIAVPLETLREEAAAAARVQNAPSSLPAVSDEEIAASANPEEVLVKDPEFK